MALLNGNFDTLLVENVLLEDLRQESVVYGELNGSAMAQMITRDAEAKGGGGFRSRLKYPRLNLHSATSPTDGYTSIPAASMPGSEDLDTSSAYVALTDDQAVIDMDMLYVDCFKIPDIHADVHAAGSLLQSARFKASSQLIIQKLEAAALLNFESQGAPSSVSAGNATLFAFDTSSEANLFSSFANISGEFARQNVPAGMKKVMFLHSSIQGKILKYPNLVSSLVQDPGNASWTQGVIVKGMNMELKFTNASSATGGLAVVPERAVLVNPLGFKVEVLRSKDSISNYCRLSSVFGMSAVGKTITAADGSAWSTAREGIIGLSVS